MYKLSNIHCPIWEGLGGNEKKNAEIGSQILCKLLVNAKAADEKLLNCF